MKKHFLIVALIFSLDLSAQNKLLFDISKIDANTKLIGRYRQYDKQESYKDLNLFIV